MCGVVPPLPNTPSWSGAQLGGAQGTIILVKRTVKKLLIMEPPATSSPQQSVLQHPEPMFLAYCDRSNSTLKISRYNYSIVYFSL
jgi:hypothetical protein